MNRQLSTIPARHPARATAAEPLPSIMVRSGCAVIRALPACVNLELYAGDDFTLRIDVTDASGEPVDLSAATVRAQIRTEPEAPDISGEFDPSVEDSAIFLHLTSATSAQLPPKTVWDIDITREGRVTTLASGTIELTPEVSR